MKTGIYRRGKGPQPNNRIHRRSILLLVLALAPGCPRAAPDTPDAIREAAVAIDADWSSLRASVFTMRVSESSRSDGCRAEHRLCARYRHLSARGKPKQHVVTVIARELLGFIWAIGVATERAAEQHAA